MFELYFGARKILDNDTISNYLASEILSIELPDEKDIYAFIIYDDTDNLILIAQINMNMGKEEYGLLGYSPPSNDKDHECRAVLYRQKMTIGKIFILRKRRTAILTIEDLEKDGILTEIETITFYVKKRDGKYPPKNWMKTAYGIKDEELEICKCFLHVEGENDKNCHLGQWKNNCKNPIDYCSSPDNFDYLICPKYYNFSAMPDEELLGYARAILGDRDFDNFTRKDLVKELEDHRDSIISSDFNISEMAWRYV